MLTVTQRASADLRTFIAFIWRSNSFVCCLTICRCSARLCRNCSQTNVSLASHVTSTNAGGRHGRRPPQLAFVSLIFIEHCIRPDQSVAQQSATLVVFHAYILCPPRLRHTPPQHTATQSDLSESASPSSTSIDPLSSIPQNLLCLFSQLLELLGRSRSCLLHFCLQKCVSTHAFDANADQFDHL